MIVGMNCGKGCSNYGPIATMVIDAPVFASESSLEKTGNGVLHGGANIPTFSGGTAERYGRLSIRLFHFAIQPFQTSRH
jgi:hypothetical protein